MCPETPGECGSCKLPGDAPGQVGGEGLEAHTGAVCPSPSLSPRQGFAPESPIHSSLPASPFLSHTLTSQAPSPGWCCPSDSLELLMSLLNSILRPRAPPVRWCRPCGLVVVLGGPTLERGLMDRPGLCSKPCVGEGAPEVAFQGRPSSPLPQGAGFGMS